MVQLVAGLELVLVYRISLRCHFTNGQLLSASGLNASAAGMVARTL
jgi:hypothetical protein